ncbi:hypothetical protein U9M48_001544 [Paspalum notatum var. saurae]|uniref:HMA domain-containing protein n=1 Tax=Paspalum notatum var. saurae TaxID=547442 RepID=A0AAQ3PP03_PASNO
MVLRSLNVGPCEPTGQVACAPASLIYTGPPSPPPLFSSSHCTSLTLPPSLSLSLSRSLSACEKQRISSQATSMAEKISMIIILVDLDCYKCYNKMRKILCQLQDQERIRTISFDDKSKTITIVGPFDPLRLACKIRCKGGKVVKDIHIVDAPPQMMAGGPPPSPPAKKGKQKNKDKPPTPTPEPPPPAPPTPPPEMLPPPSPVRLQAPPDREMAAGMPAFVEEKRPKERPAELEPPPMSPPHKERPPPPMDMPNPMPVTLPPPKERPPPPCRPVERTVEYVIPTVEIPSWPAPPVGPCGCPCCAPCYQGCYDGCRCCCCGQVLSYGSARPLLPAAGACGYGYRGCRTFSDEDPSAACSVM